MPDIDSGYGHTFELSSPLSAVQEQYAASTNQESGDWGVQRRFEEACADPISFAAVRNVCMRSLNLAVHKG